MDSVISIGNKIELKQLAGRNSKDSETRNYISQVLDFEDEYIIAAMPIYEGHLIPLESGQRFEAFFSTKRGLYRTECIVRGRKKVNNIYMVRLEVTTQMQKFQRREFFRLDCNIDVNYYVFTIDEIKYCAENNRIPDEFVNGRMKGVIIDISGGGLRIVSPQLHNKGDMLYIDFVLKSKNINIRMGLLGKVIESAITKNRLDLYEQRIEFISISSENREKIVKFIFEEQRRMRHNEHL